MKLASMSRPLLGAVVALSAFGAEPVERQAPEFVIRYTDGRQDLLSQYRGKVVALEFLSTT